MGGNRERNVYRIVVIIVVVLGALAVMWALSQGSKIEGNGVFDFLPDPTNGNGLGE